MESFEIFQEKYIKLWLELGHTLRTVIYIVGIGHKTKYFAYKYNCYECLTLGLTDVLAIAVLRRLFENEILCYIPAHCLWPSFRTKHTHFVSIWFKYFCLNICIVICVEMCRVCGKYQFLQTHLHNIIFVLKKKHLFTARVTT